MNNEVTDVTGTTRGTWSSPLIVPLGQAGYAQGAGLVDQDTGVPGIGS